MIAIALLIMFSGVFDKLDDAESRLEKKEQEKRAAKRRDVSGGGSFGDSSISYSEKDSEYQEDWIEFHQRHDDLDRMEAITAKYGPDWTGVDVERPFGDEDPEQPTGNFVDYE